jgi:hypothetical protein
MLGKRKKNSHTQEVSNRYSITKSPSDDNDFIPQGLKKYGPSYISKQQGKITGLNLILKQALINDMDNINNILG